ncbi:MAG: hypothetical protein HKP02_03630 [Xanthomonadales bacterium]|nr:hypothetical protein [Xanthomonadales bacterium]
MKQALLASLVVFLAACSSFQWVSIDEMRSGRSEDIRTGDQVQVITRDNEKMEFAVTRINEHGLGGEFGFIPYDNMQRLRVRRPGGGGSPEWIWVAVGLIAAAALIASADSVAVCSPGPCPTPETQ